MYRINRKYLNDYSKTLDRYSKIAPTFIGFCFFLVFSILTFLFPDLNRYLLVLVFFLIMPVVVIITMSILREAKLSVSKLKKTKSLFIVDWHEFRFIPETLFLSFEQVMCIQCLMWNYEKERLLLPRELVNAFENFKAEPSIKNFKVLSLSTLALPYPFRVEKVLSEHKVLSFLMDTINKDKGIPEKRLFAVCDILRRRLKILFDLGVPLTPNNLAIAFMCPRKDLSSRPKKPIYFSSSSVFIDNVLVDTVLIYSKQMNKLDAKYVELICPAIHAFESELVSLNGYSLFPHEPMTILQARDF